MNCKDCGKENIADIHTCSPQIRELSDEEIEQVGKTNDGVLKLFYMIQGNMTGLQFKEALNDFARAILKKASEK